MAPAAPAVEDRFVSESHEPPERLYKFMLRASSSTAFSVRWCVAGSPDAASVMLGIDNNHAPYEHDQMLVRCAGTRRGTGPFWIPASDFDWTDVLCSNTGLRLVLYDEYGHPQPKR